MQVKNGDRKKTTKYQNKMKTSY